MKRAKVKTSNKTEIVILGANGFIGKYIHEYFQNKGIKVLGLSSKDVDLTNPKSSHKLSNIFSKNTILIFAAAVTREKGDTVENMLTNIVMATNVARALVETKIKKCVFLSTCDVYGYPKALPITEKTKLDPQTPYAASKSKSELILKKTKCPLLILRYNGVFGPGQTGTKYGPNSFIKSILDNRVANLWGDGEELRDMLFVKDLASIIGQLALSDAQDVYNIASGKSMSFVDVVEKLRSIATVNFTVKSQKRTGQKFDQFFNIKKLQKALTKISFTPTMDALKETYKELI